MIQNSQLRECEMTFPFNTVVDSFKHYGSFFVSSYKLIPWKTVMFVNVQLLSQLEFLYSAYGINNNDNMINVIKFTVISMYSSNIIKYTKKQIAL